MYFARFLARKLSLICLLLLHTGSAWAQAPELSQNDLRRQYACLVNVESMLTQASKIYDVWLTDPSSAFHIETNVRVLDERRRKHLNALTELANRRFPVATEAVTVDSQILAIDRFYLEVQEQSLELANFETTLLMSISDVEIAIENLRATIGGLDPICGEQINQSLNSLSETLKNADAEIYKLRSVVTQGLQNRNQVFLWIAETQKKRVLAAYAQHVGMDLIAVRRSLEQVLGADRLHAEIQQWAFESVVVAGVGRGAAQRYEWEAAVRQARTDIFRGERLQARASRLGQLPGGIDQVIQGTINNHLRTMRNRLQTWETNGWQSFFSGQKSSAAARRGDSELLQRPTCVTALKRFEAFALQVSTLAEFRQSTKLWIQMNQACRKSPRS